jgi:hypothetical protein
MLPHQAPSWFSIYASTTGGLQICEQSHNCRGFGKFPRQPDVSPRDGLAPTPQLLASLCNAVGVECPSGHLRVADARLTTVEKIDAIRRKWGAKRASGSEIGPGRDSGGDGPIRSTLKKPRGSIGCRPGASFRVAKKRQQGSWPLERITGIAMPRCLSRPLVSIPRQSRGLYLSEPLEAALRGR